MTRGDQKIAAQSVTSTQHEFSRTHTKGRKTNVRSNQYSSRIQKNSVSRHQILMPRRGAEWNLQNVHMQIRDNITGDEYVTHGRTTGLRGREARLETGSALEGREIVSITSDDDGRATLADRQKEITILAALQGKISLFGHPFLQYIFTPDREIKWPACADPTFVDPPIMSIRPLNESQELAVKSMLSPEPHITVIQGPPGTGKTTVIATYVNSAIASGVTGIWLVAQTNVAVKNMAEKLADSGFYNWRLLVSSEFHDDW